MQAAISSEEVSGRPKVAHYKVPIVTTDPIVLSALFAELSLGQLPLGAWAAAISRTFALKVSGLPWCGCNCGCTLLHIGNVLSICE